MPVREPVHPLEKRDLLHADPPSAAKVQAIAKKLLAAGRHSEAVDYIEVSPSEDLLAAAEREAVSRGYVWLLHQVDRIRGRKSEPATWEKVSDAAQRAERWVDAVRALDAGGQTERAEALRASRCPTYEPFRPLGK